MTPSDKSSPDLETRDNDRAPEPVAAYEAPVLIPLGNVHALLAGGGTSVTKDSPPTTRRR